MTTPKRLILESEDGARFEVEVSLVQSDAPETEPITEAELDYYFSSPEQQ